MNILLTAPVAMGAIRAENLTREGSFTAEKRRLLRTVEGIYIAFTLSREGRTSAKIHEGPRCRHIFSSTPFPPDTSLVSSVGQEVGARRRCSPQKLCST